MMAHLAPFIFPKLDPFLIIHQEGQSNINEIPQVPYMLRNP